MIFFKFHQDLIVSQIFGTQKISDDDVLKYFQQTEEKIHSMDTRKPLKFPDRAPASKANAIKLEMAKPRQKERERKDPNQYLLLTIMDSRRVLNKKKVQGCETSTQTRSLTKTGSSCPYKPPFGKARGR